MIVMTTTATEIWLFRINSAALKAMMKGRRGETKRREASREEETEGRKEEASRGYCSREVSRAGRGDQMR
jgi:hypothetical protein